MKYIIKLMLAAVLITSAVSCEDFIGGDINSDPNNPLEVTVSGQMPAFELMLSGLYGGDFSAFGTMLSQQVEGVARQWSSFNQYTGLTPNRFDAAWTNMYENILNETRIARAQAIDQGLNHHLAVININEAFALMIAADVWDDIPYSEALQGNDNKSPKYDSQASIYTLAISYIDDSITLLEGPQGTASVGSADVFYNGNTGAWIKAAKALKARALLHLGDCAGASALAEDSFTSNADDWTYEYPDVNSAGPWFRFNRDRTGDLEFHPQMLGLMESFNDSVRLDLFNMPFNTSNTFLKANWLQELITYREMQFVIAECALMSGDKEKAYKAYLNGIQAAFDHLAEDIDGLGVENNENEVYLAYVAQESVAPGAAALTLEDIITQKYVALFLDFEVYNDFRRTGFPNLTPVSGTAVPVRWDYPSQEYLFNTNAPADGSINIYTDRVGWNR